MVYVTPLTILKDTFNELQITMNEQKTPVDRSLLLWIATKTEAIRGNVAAPGGL